jgi:ribonuclease PH
VSLPRRDNRRPHELRPVRITRGFTRNAPGSVLIEAGETIVLCTASWKAEVPKWKQGRGGGWLTAEYDMLPGATAERRERNRKSLDGRTQEIQRLIGRSLRAVVNLDLLGENTIMVDCDVLQADGGTRTASVTGAYVAVCDAVRVARRNKWIRRSPIHDSVAAVSVGIVQGRTLLDLDYREDSTAEVDMNLVMTGRGGLVEVQGTGEQGTFSPEDLDRLLKVGTRGIKELLRFQQASLRKRM